MIATAPIKPIVLTSILLAEKGKKDWAYEMYTAYAEVKYFQKTTILMATTLKMHHNH